MADRSPLSENAVREALGRLPGWSYADNRLTKSFQLGSFREAVGFIVRIAFDAESMDHHPELTNVYNRVTVTLTTHDAGNRVTALDVELAARIEAVSWV